MSVEQTGNVGIGTVSPTQALDINGKLRIRNLLVDNSQDSILVAGGDGTVGYRSAATLGGGGSGQWLTSGSNIYNMNAGSVAIGTSAPALGYSLSVIGSIICEELQILPSGSWPDYVFDKKYDLWSLEEVEQFIPKIHLRPMQKGEDEGISVV